MNDSGGPGDDASGRWVAPNLAEAEPADAVRGRSGAARQARRVMFHCAPRESRCSIGQHGLNSGSARGGLAGTYLWERLEDARAYALWFEDIWVVDVTGLLVEESYVPGEAWLPTSLEPGRVRLLMNPRTAAA